MRVEPAAQHRTAALGHAPRHRHRFPARGRAIVHRGIGNFDPEQPRDLGLEFEQHLQRPLRDFGLIRGISGQELAALDQVIDRGRDVMPVGPRPEEERCSPGTQVLPRQRAHVPLDRHLAGVEREASNRTRKARFGGHIDEQVVDGCSADHAEHGGAVVLSQGEVTHSICSFTILPLWGR